MMIQLILVLLAFKKSPKFTEFRVPPAVAMSGPDQMISQAGRSTPLL